MNVQTKRTTTIFFISFTPYYNLLCNVATTASTG